MQRRYRRLVVALLALGLMASMSPVQFAAGTLQIDAVRVIGNTVQVTVSNLTDGPQSAFLVVVAEIGPLVEISVQPITVAAGGTVNKATHFPEGITRLISVGISEGPDPVTSISR